jgi:hypothetical protein
VIFRHLRNVRGFFSDYYLGTVFSPVEGKGRRQSDRELDAAYRRFARIYERAEGRAVDAPACRERLVRPLLRDVLGFHLGAERDGVHGLYAGADLEARGERPMALTWSGGWSDDPDGGRGQSVPARRVEQALAAAGLGHGFLVTGERFRIVRAAGEGPRGAYLEVDLPGLAADLDPESFAAFYRLCHISAYVPEGAEVPRIRRIEAESREHAARVSDDLREAVFAAAETLVDGLLRDAQSHGRIQDPARLGEESIRVYRDAALTALYRILFILYAEARDPRLDEHRLYKEAYSAQGLVDDLLRDPCRDQPENRHGLWMRLLALFRIYDEGLPAITPWEHIPPRGGDFFRADTPEGRILGEARLPDRTVAQVLLDLTTAKPRRGVGRERVSFRELDIESLGAVYEGLLEHEPRVAQQITIELRVQGRLLALSAAETARLCRQRGLVLSGDPAVVEGTDAETFARDAIRDDEEDELVEADEEHGDEPGDEPEEEDEGRGRGGTARLVRRLEPGRFHFVPGPARKGSGSFYTPRPLVHDLVRHALGPLVIGKSPVEMERLRVLDPACGSAHFLVEAMRFLGQALHRAYVEAHGRSGPPNFKSTTGQGWDDDWRASDEEARAANSEARAWCKRRVAERCLFGVDQNPTAVALARVALWIESLAGDRPLTYFAHHVRCGNSLLGTWLDALHRPPLPSMARDGGAQGDIFARFLETTLREAAETRGLIDQAADAGAVEGESLEEQEFKERQRRRADALLAGARLLFDLRSASAFVPAIWSEWATLTSLARESARLDAHVRTRPWWPSFEVVRERERFFHWEIEFPEVLLQPDRPGFDTVLGNPPWDKVLPTKHDFYARSDVLIRAFRSHDLDRRIRELHEAVPGLEHEFERYRERTTTIARLLRQGGDFPLARAQSQAAHEDVSKYFVDRAARLVADGGAVGMVAPSVLYNGDGAVGLREFLLEQATIERFYGFENRRKIFPIHSSYKFVSLVFRKGAPGGAFHAAFMRHDLSELDDDGPKPWIVRITRREIARLSPESKALLEYRSPRDQEIVQVMHDGRPTLGGSEPGSWGSRLVSWRAHEINFNATEDRDLWTDPATRRPYSTRSVLGCEPADVDEAITRMRDKGFWPVFEGKHVEQFMVGVRPFRWWMSVESAVRKYGRRPSGEPSLVFRETASNTNERTCIAAVLPACSVTTNKLSGLVAEAVEPDAAATVVNSFVFDFMLRLRVTTNVHFTYIRPVAVPRSEIVRRLPHVPTRAGWRVGSLNVADDKDLWPLLWEANRAVAEAYGLGAEDFAHILASFPVFARKRPAFHAWLLERMAEWRSGRARGAVRYPAAAERPVPRAAEPSAQ